MSAPYPASRPKLPTLGLILVLLATAVTAHGQTRNESEIFDVLPVLLARNLALDGDVAAITAQSVNFDGLDDALYIFEPDTFGQWSQTAMLVPSDFVVGDQLGASVAVDGGRVAVGAYNHDVDGFDETGAIWIFERDGAGQWIESAKVTTTPLAVARRLGNDAIGLDGDVLAGIGVTGPNQNALFVFERDAGGNWVQVFVSPSASGIQYLDLHDDTIVIGRPSADGSDGEIRIYQRLATGWALRQSFGGTSRIEARSRGRDRRHDDRRRHRQHPIARLRSAARRTL